MLQQGVGLLEGALRQIVSTHSDQFEDLVSLLGGGVVYLEERVEFALIVQHNLYL